MLSNSKFISYTKTGLFGLVNRGFQGQKNPSDLIYEIRVTLSVEAFDSDPNISIGLVNTRAPDQSSLLLRGVGGEFTLMGKMS